MYWGKSNVLLFKNRKKVYLFKLLPLKSVWMNQDKLKANTHEENEVQIKNWKMKLGTLQETSSPLSNTCLFTERDFQQSIRQLEYSCHYFLALIKPNELSFWGLNAKSDDFARMLERNKVVFPDEIPSELPLIRGVE